MRFEGKVALIVGAAGGIAAATARIMAREGAAIMGADRDAAGLAALADDIGRMPGARLTTVVADAMREDEAARVAQATLDAFGRIDILVSTVGGSGILKNMNATLEELTAQDWIRVTEFNLLPCFLFCKAVVPAMKRQGAGRIVLVSSHAATGRIRRNSAYAAAKAGVSGLTRKLANELGPFGIHCNDIMLARTRTPEAAAQEARQDPEGTAAYLRTVPLRRLATPDDAARAICFLASDDASYVTGATLDVMGGL